MTNVYYQRPEGEEIAVDLRDPRLAAFLAWLWPGAGHFYQRRFLKGFLFMICIMGTFIYGMFLGQGRVVYASFRTNDFRWQYICQAGIGTPAMFAMIQKVKTDGGGDPFFVLAERYPENYEDPNNENQLREFEIIDKPEDFEGKTIKDGFMAPPYIVTDPNQNDVLGMWHASLKQGFDVGTIFCVLAGLLNMLAIYDAFAGPLLANENRKSRIDRGNPEEEPQPDAGEKSQATADDDGTTPNRASVRSGDKGNPKRNKRKRQRK